MKPIRLSKHAFEYIKTRGFTRDEVINAIQTARWKSASYGRDRFECSQELPFKSDWNGKYYKNKRIRPVFEERELEIVVITVYTYYY